jgi:hypothetical protein
LMNNAAIGSARMSAIRPSTARSRPGLIISPFPLREIQRQYIMYLLICKFSTHRMCVAMEHRIIWEICI